MHWHEQDSAEIFDSFRATLEGEYPAFVSAQSAGGTLQIRTGYINAEGEIQEDFEMFDTLRNLLRGFRVLKTDYATKGYIIK